MPGEVERVSREIGMHRCVEMKRTAHHNPRVVAITQTVMTMESVLIERILRIRSTVFNAQTTLPA